jgi:hypothetical protein
VDNHERYRFVGQCGGHISDHKYVPYKSCLVLCINTLNVDGEDAEKTCELIGLVGCALLTVLDAIDQAGELKTTSRFLDLALVIGYYLELSHDLPAYGIEGSCIKWRKEAVYIFRNAKLDTKKALFDTERRLNEFEHAPNFERVGSDDETEDESDAKPSHHRHATEKTTCAWAATMETYKERHGDRIGLQQYDITKFTRGERTRASFNGEGLLADVPSKDRRQNFLDMV